MNRNSQGCYRQVRQPYGRVPVKNMQRQQPQMYATAQPCDKQQSIKTQSCASTQPCANQQPRASQQSCANTQPCAGTQREKEQTPSVSCECGINEAADSAVCVCRSNTSGINMPIGMCYVPWQKWGRVYDACSALERGTLFPDLDKPFLGGYC